MSEQNDKISARLEAIRKPAAKKFPVAKVAIPAAAMLIGVSIGVVGMSGGDADTAPKPLALPTSDAAEFQTGDGLDGFTFAQPREKASESSAELQITPTAKPDEEKERQAAEIAALRAEVEALRANPVTVTDEATVAALQAQLDQLAAEAHAKDLALADAQRETDRVRIEAETAEEMRLKAAEAEKVRQAQVSSPMVAYRAGSSGGGGGNDDMVSIDDRSRTGKGDSFLRAGRRAEVQQAEVVANPAQTLIQGTMIEATLETGINSQLPGVVSAVVSRDVWSMDMSRILVPRGSKLFGRYESDIGQGQRRILVAWDRLVTTDGQTATLEAYGADRVGQSGLSGKVNNHTLARFSAAAAVSIIGAVPTILAAQYDDETSSDTAENVGTGLSDAVGNVMADYLRMAPTITVAQGAVVTVRINSDLELF